ncbi:hypothetical protein BpHYR1_045375 [Brachionus plicatilis]|uniref:Uncharacterized protein n=1 Tax=Brachionus plicatilis TaxID=10195 RepID=A0A3M7QXL9_BRAPC|nr:hypothetical protein BpHYR1_045375 [Brachionus plicatilis]
MAVFRGNKFLFYIIEINAFQIIIKEKLNFCKKRAGLAKENIFKNSEFPLQKIRQSSQFFLQPEQTQQTLIQIATLR